MCLIALAYDAHPEYALVVAANRDESFKRPTDRADFWEAAPDLLAGRDLTAGGTWLGITKQGRFGAVTNYRDPAQFGRQARSRGELLREYLQARAAPGDFFEARRAEGPEYNGFNILAADLPGGVPGALVYHTNSDERAPNGRVDALKRGVYALSNHLLDTPWPKVEIVRAGIGEILSGAAGGHPDALFDALMAMMGDDRRAPDADLPDTGIGLEFERALSSVLIPGDERYGTCSTTVLTVDRKGGVRFQERAFQPGGVPGELREYRFQLEGA